MSPLLERLGVERPIVQAGMGGGLSGHELAAAVSGAGGLGTIGLATPSGLAREVALGGGPGGPGARGRFGAWPGGAGEGGGRQLAAAVRPARSLGGRRTGRRGGHVLGPA